MTPDRWDEVWHRLREWTNGQGPAERMAAQILYAEGYRDIDPSHPLGGPDGGKDALATRDGRSWVMAAYFPRGQRTFGDIKSKAIHDYKGVAQNDAAGMVFVTNQQLTLSERQEIEAAVPGPVALLHLDRITSVLDRPDMSSVRTQFLSMSSPDVTPAHSAREILDLDPPPRHTGDHNLLFDYMMLLRVVVAPAVGVARHRDARDPRPALNRATASAQAVAADWPLGVSKLLHEAEQGWQSGGPHLWTAGWVPSRADALIFSPYAAATFATTDVVFSVHRTWPTAILDEAGEFNYCAAREPEVAAEFLIALALAGELCDPDTPGDELDVAVQLAAAPAGSAALVSSLRAVSGNRFGEPAKRLRNPVADVPSHHIDSGRFAIADVRAGYPIVEELLSPWLVRFNRTDLFQRLRTG